MAGGADADKPPFDGKVQSTLSQDFYQLSLHRGRTPKPEQVYAEPGCRNPGNEEQKADAQQLTTQDRQGETGNHPRGAERHRDEIAHPLPLFCPHGWAHGRSIHSSASFEAGLN